MFEKIKYESSLVKKWFAQIESNDNTNEPGVIDIVLELMHHFDIKSNKRLLKRFEKLKYAETFFEQESLRDVVSKGKFLRGTFGAALKEFWESPDYDKDLFKDGLKIAKENKKDFNLTKKEEKFWAAIFAEHDLIHLFFDLKNTTMGELSVISFTIAKSFRRSFFTIIFFALVGAVLEFLKQPIGLAVLKRRVKEVHSIKLQHYDILKVVWKAYRNGKRCPWMLSINWHDRLHEPLHIVKEELGLDVNANFKFYYHVEKEMAKVNWWKEYGKRTAYQQQILVNRLVENKGVPFKILP